MRRRSDAALWAILAVTLAVIAAWPPHEGRSLALKLTTWLADPRNVLPTLPPQLEMGMGDDPVAVEVRDAIVRRYDSLYNRGGLTRMRMDLKVARDPFNPETERQFLLLFGAMAVFLVWRWENGRGTR